METDRQSVSSPDFSEIYSKNRNFSFFLIGGLGTIVCSLVFFKLLMIDFVTYTSPVIAPILLLTSVISTCLCINGWLLSISGKVFLSFLSLTYPMFPIVCRVFDLPLIKNEIVQIDDFLTGEVNLTMLALFATIVYSVVFQSYQIYFASLLRRKPSVVAAWLNDDVIPFEKGIKGNFVELNRSFKLRKLLESKETASSRDGLILFRDKLRTFHAPSSRGDKGKELVSI